MGDGVVEIHYRLPEQEVDGASCLQGLVLMGALNIPLSAGGTTQQRTNNPGTCWTSTDDNFLTQLAKEPTRGDGPHDHKQGRTGQECEGRRQPWLQ